MKNTSFRISENEIILFQYCLSESINDVKIQNLISTFSFSDQNYFNSIQNKEAQKRTLFGRIILRYIADNLGINEPEFVSISVTGKPFFKDHVDFDFNISHSGNIVGCCVTKNSSIGIDLELIRPVDIEIYRNYFDFDEWQFITNSEHPEFEFQKLWVRKEAVVKADGRGMEIEMSSFNCMKRKTEIESDTWHIQEVVISPEYVCAVACNHFKNIYLVNFNTVFESEINN